jgi:hypothetical protein
MPGYVRLRSAGKSYHGMHKSCNPMKVDGVLINIASTLDQLNEDWGRQLGIYAWLLGAPVGSSFIIGVDQIVCNANAGSLPGIRVAEHRLKVASKFQEQTFGLACEIWDIIRSDWIFRDMTKEESARKCEALDGVAQGLIGEGTAEDRWFAEVCRS